MVDSFIALMRNEKSLGHIVYQGPLRPYLVPTDDKQLATYFCLEDIKHDGVIRPQIRLTDEGFAEVERYSEMVRRPVAKQKFSEFARYFSMIPRSTKQKEEKILVDSWQLSVKYSVESLYFGSKDYLMVVVSTQETPERYQISFKDDYEDYVNNMFSLEERARLYLSWLERHVERSESDLFYDSFSLQMASKSLSQREEYTSVIASHDNIMIPSDGLGVFSCMCILSGITYYSWEPLAIGERARKLHLIHSTEFEKRDSLYVFFYCAQYYQLPLFPGQRYLVVDVPSLSKPGFSRNSHVSVSHKNIIYEHLYPQDIMAIESAFSLDFVTTSLMSTMKIPAKDPLESQFIVASNFASLDACLKSGFYSKEYWSNKRARMSKADLHKYGKVDSILSRVKQKTLLLFDRTFPFRRGSSTKWHVEDNYLKRDGGPGWYFFSNSMWYGEAVSPKDIRTDYSYDSGHFIFSDSTKPKNVQYVRVHDYLEEIYSTKDLKVCLIAVYRTGGIAYQVYAPESKILRKTILLADT